LTGSSAPARRSIAVLGFRNLSGRPEEGWLSAALAEMLSTELEAGENLRLVSGEDVARTTLDLPLADTCCASQPEMAWPWFSLEVYVETPHEFRPPTYAQSDFSALRTVYQFPLIRYYPELFVWVSPTSELRPPTAVRY
jgi:hypothetical protein